MLTPAELDSAVTFPSVSVWDLHTQTKADTLVIGGKGPHLDHSGLATALTTAFFSKKLWNRADQQTDAE
jgi:hypothetical protein